MKLIKLDNVRVSVTQCSLPAVRTRLSRLEAGHSDCELHNFLYSRARPTRSGPARFLSEILQPGPCRALLESAGNDIVWNAAT